MNENKKLTFLPVGSVVRLKGGERNVIIIGYTPIEAGKTEMWDYLGGMWPTGVITSDRNLLFNRDQIEEVIFEGFGEKPKKRRRILNMLKHNRTTRVCPISL